MGGLGRETNKFYSRLVEILADKKNTQYSFMMAWLKRKILSSPFKLVHKGSRTCRSNELLDSLDRGDPVTSEVISKL